MEKVKIKAACRRVSEALYKSCTILTPGLSAVALCEGGSEKTSSVFICVADYAVTSKQNGALAE